MAQPSESTDDGPLGRGLTVEARNGPIASDAAGNAGQLEDEGPGVGVRVIVGSRDVDAVDVPAHPLADLGLLGYESRGVVINIYQVDLQRAGAGGGRRAWEQRRKGRGGGCVWEVGGEGGRENSIKVGKKGSDESAEGEEGRATREGGEANHEREEKNPQETTSLLPVKVLHSPHWCWRSDAGGWGWLPPTTPPHPQHKHTHTPPPLPPIETHRS